MLSPKKVKWRKQHRGSTFGFAKRGSIIEHGDFALKAIEGGRLTSRQIEAARIAISRSLKRGGKIWIRIFPDKPITQKPAETRMGSGKGNPEFWVSVIKPGRILYEIIGISREQAKETLRLAANKLPVKTSFISREINI